MKNFWVALIILGTLSNSSFAGECDKDTLSYIQEHGRAKDTAIADLNGMRQKVRSLYASGTWGKGRADRKEMFEYMMQEISEMNSNIQACTERDLASITPKTKGNQSGSSTQSQAGPSDSECKSGDPSCAIRSCNRSGGKAITHRDNLGCGVVSCRFADTKYDWSSVYNNVPGSGCAGSTK